MPWNVANLQKNNTYSLHFIKKKKIINIFFFYLIMIRFCEEIISHLKGEKNDLRMKDVTSRTQYE